MEHKNQAKSVTQILSNLPDWLVEGQYKAEKPKIKQTANPEDIFQQFVGIAQHNPEGFILNDENKKVIYFLCNYFANSTELPDKVLKKGIMLAGNPGSGKSTIMQIFAKIVPFAFMYVDNICDNVRREGQTELDKIKNRGFETLCFDDFGSEAKIKHYGSHYDVMYDVVIRRCQDFVHHGTKTHFTTNFTMQNISEIYDAKIESRLHEMCNIVVLGGKLDYNDWRKK